MNGANSNTTGARQAKLRFKPAGEDSRVSKEIREELEKDGYVLIEAEVEGNIIVSPTEPTDKTKIWWQSDINGVPQGSPLIYNTSSGKWEAINADTQQYQPPDQRNGSFVTPEGTSSQSVQFSAMHGGAGYMVYLTPTKADDVDDAGAMPTTFGYYRTAQDQYGFTFKFYGIPVGGLTWLWEAREIVSQ